MFHQNLPGGFPPFPPLNVPPFNLLPGGGQGTSMPAQPPLQPPPSFTPSLSAAQTLQSGQGGPGVYAVDPGSLYGCLYKFTYVWLQNGRSFWFYPIFIGRRSVAGFRWYGFRWEYFGIDTNRIVAFRCY